MRAVMLRSFGHPQTSLTVEEIPIPTLSPGQVLVRVAAASINPSDLVFLHNLYGIKKKLPVVPGFEASGTVVASNAGLYGRWLVGRRVACKSPDDGNGVWAEYVSCTPNSCIPLKNSVTLEQGASLIVNPLTAWALFNKAYRAGHRAMIQTAAASAVGKMVARLCMKHGMALISIVRRPEQVRMLKELEIPFVLDSSDPGFAAQLQELAKRLGARIAIDCVGGDLTGLIAQAMPYGSEMVVYGALGNQDCRINPSALIFEGKKLSGFWLTEWLKTLSGFKKWAIATRVQSLLRDELSTQVVARYPLEKVHEAIDFYKKNRSNGKVLLTFGGD